MPLVMAPSFLSCGLADLVNARPINAPYPRKVIRIPDKCKKLYTFGDIMRYFYKN